MKLTGVWIDPNLMDSHQQRKYRRVEAIANLIRNRHVVNYREFLAEMQYHGLRKKVAEEYLDILKDLGKIRYDKGYVIWNEDSEGN